ncbi:YceK/YidQ family lipoprotein [Photobacterium nomapromontoriensis]|uniref:YceK/YidQ family lipoprotein n=1 Tax=Photobacterium nomapromontoriensis TaxID=2910237 RepID=UPI003D127E9F
MKVIFVTLFTFVISGCSTIASKLPSNSSLGVPYAGTEYALVNTFNCNFLVLKEYPPLLILSIPISAIDIGSSVIADTVLLPIDLLPIANDHKDKTSICSFNF